MGNHTSRKWAGDTTDTSHLDLQACLHQIFQNLFMIDRISHLLGKWLQQQYKMKISICKIDIIIFQIKAQPAIWTLLQICFHQRLAHKTSSPKPWPSEAPVATSYPTPVARSQKVHLPSAKWAGSQDCLGNHKASFQVELSKCKIKVDKKFTTQKIRKVAESWALMNHLTTPSLKVTTMQTLEIETRQNLEFSLIMIGHTTSSTGSQSQNLTIRHISILINSITIPSIWIMIQRTQIIDSLTAFNRLRMNQTIYLTSQTQIWWVTKATLPLITQPHRLNHTAGSQMLHIRNLRNNSSWAPEGSLGLNSRQWCREMAARW